MPVSDVLLNAAEADDHQAMQMANQWSHSSGVLLARGTRHDTLLQRRYCIERPKCTTRFICL